MVDQPASLPEKLLAATEALAESLQAAEPFVLYERAALRLKADGQAQNLLEQLSAVQAQVRSQQMTAGLAQEDLDRLRNLQYEAQNNRAIMEHAGAQQSAIQYLREINQEISGLLGVDFAGLARQSSC